MDLPEPIKNIFMLYADRQAFKFFNPPDYVWKQRIETDFLAKVEEGNYKQQYEYFDYMFNGRAKIVHLPKRTFEGDYELLWKCDGLNRSQWQSTFPKHIYGLIKDLKKGDIIECDKILFLVSDDAIFFNNSLLEPYVSKPMHYFNVIFDFPLSYWEDTNIVDLGRFKITFPPNMQFKSIDLKIGAMPYKITIFCHRNINYGIITTPLTHNYEIDNSNCSSDRYISISVYSDVLKILSSSSDLEKILQDHKIHKSMLLMKID